MTRQSKNLAMYRRISLNDARMQSVYYYLLRKGVTGFLLLLCAANLHAQLVDSGTTGDCMWELTGTAPNYTLTISEIGAMENYSSYVGN